MILTAYADGGVEGLNGIAGWTAQVMTTLGSPGVGAVIALENVFPPVPSEVVLPLGGFLAGQGELNLAAVIAWATVGSVLGALGLYALGAVFGRNRLRKAADRLPLVSIDDVDRAGRWFARRGGHAVFIGRFVPVIRSLISVPAGVERMPLPRFVLYTCAGSAIWNTLFVLLGYALGSQWQRVGQYSGYINNAILSLIALTIIIVAFRRLLVRREAK